MENMQHWPESLSNPDELFSTSTLVVAVVMIVFGFWDEFKVRSLYELRHLLYE
jgi:hypothetical protein